MHLISNSVKFDRSQEQKQRSAILQHTVSRTIRLWELQENYQNQDPICR